MSDYTEKLRTVRELYKLGAKNIRVGDIEVSFDEPYRPPPRKVKVVTPEGTAEFLVDPPEPTARERELDELRGVLEDTV